MTAGLASDWKVRDEYTDWHGNRSLVAKKVIAGTGGGGGGYVAKAVTITSPTTFLSRVGGLVGVTNSPLQTFSGWFKTSAFNNGFYINPDAENFSQYVTQGPNTSGDQVTDAQWWISNGADNVFSSNDAKPITANEWYWLGGAADTNHPAGQKIVQLWLGNAEDGDLDITGVVADTGGAFNALFEGNTFAFPDLSSDAPFFNGDVSDFWFAPGIFIDFSVEENRRLFIGSNGKPVDLGSNGQTPTATAPAIFFSGDKDTFGQPNLGTGGIFTLTGTLTNATTSPSD